MVEDVKMAVEGKLPVYFHGRPGGMTPTPAEIVEKLKKLLPENWLQEVLDNGCCI